MSQDNDDAKAFIADLVARSRAAQKQIEHYSQEQVDALIRAMVWSVARPGVAEEIAQFTVDETQLGNYDGKFLKIQRKTSATLLDIIHDKSVGIIEEYPERNIRVLAKPQGVIGALAPSTNPEATPVIKGIHAVKGRNSIIVAPHPRAKLTNKKICDLMRAALKKMGAPEDLVIGIETPSLETTNELNVLDYGPKVTAPVLLAHAERGHFPLSLYESLADVFPNCTLIQLPAGHLLPLEAPQLTAEALARFA